MKISTGGKTLHQVEIEIGETIEVVFKPLGPNSLPGGPTTIAVRLSTVTLSPSSLAVGIHPNSRHRFSTEHNDIILVDLTDAVSLDFVVDGEILHLERK